MLIMMKGFYMFLIMMSLGWVVDEYWMFVDSICKFFDVEMVLNVEKWVE